MLRPKRRSPFRLWVTEMNTPVFRLFDGANDLRKMQRLVQSLWPKGGRFHVGDLAWQRSGTSGGGEALWRTAIWEEGDNNVVGWGWLHLPGHLYLATRPDRPDIIQEVLAWFEREASSEELTTDVLDTEAHLVSALQAHGYKQCETSPFDLYVKL